MLNIIKIVWLSFGWYEFIWPDFFLIKPDDARKTLSLTESDLFQLGIISCYPWLHVYSFHLLRMFVLYHTVNISRYILFTRIHNKSTRVDNISLIWICFSKKWSVRTCIIVYVIWLYVIWLQTTRIRIHSVLHNEWKLQICRFLTF